MTEYLIRCTLFHNKSIIHKYDLIGHISGKCHLMGNDDHGHLLICQSFDDLQDFTGQLLDPARKSVIKAQNIRAKGQGTAIATR